MESLGRKFDADKPMMSLVPPDAELEIAKVLTFGAKKYDIDNWKYVKDGKRRYLDAMLRHITAYRKGETLDPESGLHHLAHAGCCLMFILDSDVSGIPLTPADSPQNIETEQKQDEITKLAIDVTSQMDPFLLRQLSEISAGYTDFEKSN